MAEQWLRERLLPERYSIVRPVAVWGEDDPTLTKRIRDFLAVSPWIVHFGHWKGRNRWPLAHVDRVARACYIAAFHPGARGKAFHVLDPEHTGMDGFYRQVAARHLPGKRLRALYLPLWCGVVIGALSTALSNLFDLEHPL